MDKNFLFDEVRCGFMIPTAIKQAWAAELEVLAEIDRICRKHNIQYFAEWGTFLGTVRHGGFVPWDDDLDILMKREDLIKFLEVSQTEFQEGFHIQNFRNQDDYWLFMYKVVGRNHMCFEQEHLRRFHNFPYIACIDVFVLDYAHRDPEEEENRRVLCKYIMAVADSIVEGRLTDAKEIKLRLSRIEEMGNYPKNSLKFYEDPVEMGRYMYGLMEERFMEVSEEDADCLVQLFPQGLRGDKRHYPKEYYDNPIELPFEYTTIPVPRFYDQMLRKRYGNYVRFVKDGGAHDYPYFEGQKKNLLKVLDFDFPEFRMDESILRAVRKRLDTANQPVSILDGYKAMLVQALDELGELGGSIETLPDAQQLAVEMGNLIELFYAEDHSSIKALERYCEEVFNCYETATAGVINDELAVLKLIPKLSEVYSELKTIVTETVINRKTAVFMPMRYENFDTMKPAWEALLKNPEWDVFLWPVTYFFKDYDNSPMEVVNESEKWIESDEAEDYIPHLICGEKANAQFLSMLHPDTIFIQDPYDEWNPNISIHPDMYSRELMGMTDELVYIPALSISDFDDISGREYSNTKYYVSTPGVVYSDKTYVGSEVIRRMYIERLTEFAGESTRDIWEKKIMVSPYSVVPTKLNSCCRRKLLYGISIGSVLEFINENPGKIVSGLEILAKQSDKIKVTVAVYPSVSSEVEGILSTAGMEGITLLEGRFNTDEFDAYYGDVIPATAEFISSGKPVMIQDWTV